MSKHGGSRLGRHLAPPRFLAFLGLFVAGFLGHEWLSGAPNHAEALALAFDIAAAVFLLSLLPLLKQSGADAIRSHADANDANRPLVLVITLLVTVVVMAAIAGSCPPPVRATSAPWPSWSRRSC